MCLSLTRSFWEEDEREENTRQGGGEEGEGGDDEEGQPTINIQRVLQDC